MNRRATVNSRVYGRPYRDRLDGRWGIIDVEDCVEGGRHLIVVGCADPDRLMISGGSAGGYANLGASFIWGSGLVSVPRPDDGACISPCLQC